MTALQWIGLIWGSLTLLGIRPTAEAAARLTAPDYSEICRGCRARRYAYWRREREWRYTYGAVGPPLMILAASAVWFLSPLLDLCHPTTRCSGPPCLACTKAQPIPSEKGKPR